MFKSSLDIQRSNVARSKTRRRQAPPPIHTNFISHMPRKASISIVTDWKTPPNTSTVFDKPLSRDVNNELSMGRPDSTAMTLDMLPKSTITGDLRGPSSPPPFLEYNPETAQLLDADETFEVVSKSHTQIKRKASLTRKSSTLRRSSSRSRVFSPDTPNGEVPPLPETIAPKAAALLGIATELAQRTWGSFEDT
ncbi:hypothetical protein MNV49_007334 [Pseudohyphozyma bogoriensis]|nr:hypothetical protein MNV49_007334 [Pseudohyphozyma bogoriensis]